jgi:hypothetical protein
MSELPAALDAEKYLLGTIIRDGGLLPNGLLPSDFFDPKHQDIAGAIYSLTVNGVTVDEITIGQQLKSNGSPVELYYVNDIVSATGFTLPNPHWAETIKRTSKLRRISAVAKQMESIALNPSAHPDSVVAMGLMAIESINNDRKSNGPQLMPLDDLMSFDRTNDPDNVLGNRWLCRGGSMLFSGQAGSGKSALAMMAAITWCLGRNFFGIKPIKPLRTLIIQAENDRGDCSEQIIDCCNGLNLSEFEKDDLKNNLFIYREAVATGEIFGRLLKQLIAQHQPAICYIDPLLAFAGIDISDQQQTSHFLRGIIQPILNDTGVVLICVHHTGKPKSKADKEGQTVQDAAYQYIGSSELANFFRESSYLVRCPGDAPIFKFGLTKRRMRAGMLNYFGQPSGEIYIRHSPIRGVIKWEQCDRPEAEQADEPNTQTKAPTRTNNRGLY